MVLIVVGHRGANVTLDRIECEPGRKLTTHRTAQPAPNAEDVEAFRRSPSTHLRFGFASVADARVRGFVT
jgi:hypothetical protein